MSHTSSVGTVPIRSVQALRTAVAELVDKGLNLELVPNAVPRMYYEGQIAKHVVTAEAKKRAQGKPTMGLVFHENPDECDFVLRVKDAYYDVGFIRNEQGHYVPFFDDYDYFSHEVTASQTGKGPIRDVLGADYAGGVEHWSGLREDTEAMQHAVGKLLQGYTKHATIEAATANGANVLSAMTNDAGEVVLQLMVP